MIDGVKIECTGLELKDWINSKHLNFKATINLKTAEVLNENIRAEYKGLLFQIKRSTIQKDKYHFIVSGSLHKYHNNGKHNADNFTTNNLKDVLKDLHNKFKINPKTAILKGFEFGANIQTPETARNVLKGLVAYRQYEFSILKINGVQVGKQIQQQRTQAKIYDKGKQYTPLNKNLMRFEIAVKKMEYVKPYKITVLKDLTNPEKLQKLKRLLLDFWENVIYYDKKIKYKGLTNYEQKKLLYYATPRNWGDFSKKQRYRAKRHFAKLLQKAGTSQTHHQIATLLKNKLDELTAFICPPINQHKNTQPLNNNKRKCKVCNTDITHKKATAIYCSKKCNNKYNGKRRTLKRQKQRETEIKQLRQIINNTINKNNLWLYILYKHECETYAELLHQTEIKTTQKAIKQITKVIITENNTKHKITLTSYRARKLIKEINNKNLKKWKH